MEQSEWVFYLQFTPKLSRNYFLLDEFAKEEDMSLVPMEVKDLVAATTQKSRLTIICVVENMAQRKAFMKSARLINMLIRSKNVRFYLVTCFGNLTALLDTKRNNRFRFVPLPVSGVDFCDMMRKDLAEGRNIDDRWPGGFAKTKLYEEL